MRVRNASTRARSRGPRSRWFPSNGSPPHLLLSPSPCTSCLHSGSAHTPSCSPSSPPSARTLEARAPRLTTRAPSPPSALLVLAPSTIGSPRASTAQSDRGRHSVFEPPPNTRSSQRRTSHKAVPSLPHLQHNTKPPSPRCTTSSSAIPRTRSKTFTGASCTSARGQLRPRKPLRRPP